MKDTMVITQLRSTVFIPQSIVYSPDNYSKFKTLLLPDSTAFSVGMPSVTPFGGDPNTPQYGLPWRLFKKCENGMEYNIVFLPGKIDIIINVNSKYNNDIEENFSRECGELFSLILQELGHTTVSRIAYAPSYAIPVDGDIADNVWGKILKTRVIDGTPLQDINTSFLMKQIVPFGELTIQMNLLHIIRDGFQVKRVGNTDVTTKVVLFQLDLNSIPEIDLRFSEERIKLFFSGIMPVKDSLVNNFFDK